MKISLKSVFHFLNWFPLFLVFFHFLNWFPLFGINEINFKRYFSFLTWFPLFFSVFSLFKLISRFLNKWKSVWKVFFIFQTYFLCFSVFSLNLLYITREISNISTKWSSKYFDFVKLKKKLWLLMLIFTYSHDYFVLFVPNLYFWESKPR